MSNCWVEFLKYMSAKQIGDIFTRQEMFAALKEWPQGTVEVDRVLATHKKFLKSAGRGKYEVIRKFPSYVTLTEFYSIPSDNLGYLEYTLSKKEKRTNV
jgi:hypothetical protein